MERRPTATKTEEEGYMAMLRSGVAETTSAMILLTALPSLLHPHVISQVASELQVAQYADGDVDASSPTDRRPNGRLGSIEVHERVRGRELVVDGQHILRAGEGEDEDAVQVWYPEALERRAAARSGLVACLSGTHGKMARMCGENTSACTSPLSGSVLLAVGLAAKTTTITTRYATAVKLK